MSTAIAPARTTCTPSHFSHRMARGLRRELFRDFGDCDREWQALVPMIALMARVSLVLRDRTRMVRRLAPRMRNALPGYLEHYSENAFLVAGTNLRPANRLCADHETEDVLRAHQVRLLAAATESSFSSMPVALIGQHAIERLFTRPNTTKRAVARIELISALAWFDLLHSACQSVPFRVQPKQFAIPTETGAFLGQRCDDNGLLEVRTWVTTGSNPRIDRTLAALHAWRVTPTSDTASTFRSLLSQPCN